MLTKGVELSGYFDVLGRKMVRRFATERKLALFMVFSAALLSTFLTNDVALFIVVPLTLTLRKLCEIPVTRLIIFEALAVNAGSLLTPIGNPQNILLWGRSGLSFTAFTGQMAPLALAIVASLLAVGWFAFPNKTLQYHSGTTGPSGGRVSSGAARAVYRFSYRAGVKPGAGWRAAGGVWLPVPRPAGAGER